MSGVVAVGDRSSFVSISTIPRLTQIKYTPTFCSVLTESLVFVNAVAGGPVALDGPRGLDQVQLEV